MAEVKFQKRDSDGIPKELAFDHRWYSEVYGLNPEWSNEQIEDYYLNTGSRRGHQISPYFNPSYVRQQMVAKGLPQSDDVAFDYLHNCARIDPHPLLFRSPTGFTSLNAGTQGLTDEWFNFSIMILRNFDNQTTRHSVFFDPSFVTDESGAPAQAPLETYLRHHADSEMQVSALFDPEFYLSNNAAVARAIAEKSSEYRSALQHFLAYGLDLGASPIPDFDAEFYLDRYPDVAEVTERTGTAPIKHFLFYGLAEGRDPNPYFNSKYYLEAQPNVSEDVRKLQLCGPFEHFLKIGYKAGYHANRPLYMVEVPEKLAKANYEMRCELSLQARQLIREPITFPPIEGTPAISCIVPVSGQGHMTIQLLEQLSGIAWRRDMPSIEVVVIDNGSKDITCDLPTLTRGLKIVRSEVPLGYPGACNRGAEIATGRVLVFMNNDIEVTAEAFKNGLTRLDSSPKIGAVGACIVRMNGQLQEAGSTVFMDGSSIGIGRDEDPNRAEFNLARKVDYCSGCFLFVRRSDFEALDGFDEIFSPGYYEEADLCFRLRDKGLATVYDPRVRIRHYEYASYSKGRPNEVSGALMRRNQKLFAHRHGNTLLQRPLPGEDSWKQDWFKSRCDATLSVAVVEDFYPNREIGSGFVRTADIVDSLLEAGHRVTLFICHYMANAQVDTFRQKGVEVVRSFGRNAPPNPLVGREWSFDILWICRTHNIVRWTENARAIKAKNHDLKIIFDTEAVASIRENEYRKLKGMHLIADLNERITNELSGELRPNLIVAVNETDRQAIARLNLAPVVELGHQVQIRDITPKISARDGLFFCGSFHSVDSPNFDSIKWMLEEIWPTIRREIPDAELRIAGHRSPDVPLPELVRDHPGVTYLGLVPSLDKYMDAARVFVAPTRYAGGIPHKVHEAMGAGLPVVCTELLRSQLVASGMALEDVPVLSAKATDPDTFAAACIKLLKDDTEWQRLHKGSLEFIEATASKSVFAKNLKEALDAV